MVQRVMGHEHVSTTLQLYIRRTEHHDRIRRALGITTMPDDRDDDDYDDGTADSLVPIS